MKNLKERSKGEQKRILLIGDSGSGKTSFLDTAPKPIFVADFDNGLDPLAGKDVTYEEYHDGPEKVEAWLRFFNDVKKWHREGPPGATIAVDSLTYAAQAALRQQLKSVGRGSGNIQQGDWGKAIQDVKDALGYLTTLPCHVIITAHYRMLQDDMQVTHFVPLLYGKDLPHFVPTFFNDIWRTFIEIKPGPTPVVDYKLQVLPSPKYNTLKNSLGLKQMFVEPDFTKLLGGDND